MNAKHTATPWQWHPLGNLYFVPQKHFQVVCNVGTNTNVALCPTEENAAHIVRCVNSHDDLVAALEALLPIADGAVDFTDQIDAARAALSRAKGEA